MQVYTVEYARSTRETTQGLRVVCDSVEYIEKCGWNITCDNFCTKLSFVQELFLKKFTLVKTMKKNKTELSMEFTVAKEWNVKSTAFGFRQDAMITLYCPKTLCSQYTFSNAYNQNSKALQIRMQALFFFTTK